MKVSGIVLAGGLGTRMEKICVERPKAILEFNGVPFLVYLVSWLLAYCDEVIIAAGHNSNGIYSIFGQEVWKNRNVRVIGEDIPLGTGGAIRLAAKYSANETVFICNGDTVVSDIQVNKIVGSHVQSRSQITAVLTKNEDMVQNRGAITFRNSLIIGFEEGKGDSSIHSDNASSTGCYVMNKKFILENFPIPNARNHREVSLEKELLPLFVTMGLVNAQSIRNIRVFIDFGDPLRYEALKRNEDVILRLPRLF